MPQMNLGVAILLAIGFSMIITAIIGMIDSVIKGDDDEV